MNFADLLSPPVRWVCLALLLGLTSGCDRKVQIQYQAEQARLSLSELQSQSKRLEAEIYATGNLGSYQVTQPVHIHELKRQIEQIKVEAEQLKLEKVAVNEKAEAMQREVDMYRAKFRSR